VHTEQVTPQQSSVLTCPYYRSYQTNSEQIVPHTVSNMDDASFCGRAFLDQHHDKNVARTIDSEDTLL
jgi:hypothetical protein